MTYGLWIMLVAVGLLASGCTDLNYSIHRAMSGLDCRPEVIRQHNGQCVPVTAAKAAP
jgi:hypothetical protein